MQLPVSLIYYNLLQTNMSELLRGKITGFAKPFGFIDGLKFHVNQVSGGIENGKETYYDLDNTGKINMVYGINAKFPECYLEKPKEEKQIEEVKVIKKEKPKKNKRRK